MTRTAVSSDQAPEALGPYSQAIVAGGFVSCRCSTRCALSASPDHPLPVSRRLSAAGIRFSVIRYPPRDWALLTVGLPSAPKSEPGPRRGYRVPDARAATGEGALYTPGTTVLYPGLGIVPSRRLPLLSGPSLHPAPASHLARLRLTRHQPGFKQFTRPVFPSPAAAPGH
jgi:hypothetical protein